MSLSRAGTQRALGVLGSCAGFALAVAGCGGEVVAVEPPPVAVAPVAGPAAVPVVETGDGDVREAARRLMTAATAGDRQSVLAMTLTYEETSAILAKPIDRAGFDAEVVAYYEARAREGQQMHGKIVSVNVVDQQHVPVGPKVKQPFDFAMVVPTISENGQERTSPTPWYFVRTDRGWRLSVIRDR
jgi:hypothetical protein